MNRGMCLFSLISIFEISYLTHCFDEKKKKNSKNLFDFRKPTSRRARDKRQENETNEHKREQQQQQQQ